MRGEFLYAFALGTPWAIEQNKLGAIAGVLRRHAAGVELPEAEVLAAMHGDRGGEPRRAHGGRVAVLCRRRCLPTGLGGGADAFGSA